MSAAAVGHPGSVRRTKAFGAVTVVIPVLNEAEALPARAPRSLRDRTRDGCRTARQGKTGTSRLGSWVDSMRSIGESRSGRSLNGSQPCGFDP